MCYRSLVSSNIAKGYTKPHPVHLERTFARPRFESRHSQSHQLSSRQITHAKRNKTPCVDILLGLKTKGIPRYRSAPFRLVGSGCVMFGLRFGFEFADSQHRSRYQAKPVYRWNRYVSGHWAISRECQTPRDSSTEARILCLLCDKSFDRSLGSPDSELLALVTRA